MALTTAHFIIAYLQTLIYQSKFFINDTRKKHDMEDEVKECKLIYLVLKPWKKREQYQEIFASKMKNLDLGYGNTDSGIRHIKAMSE